MDKDKQKALSYIKELERRTERLRKQADNWTVDPNFRKTLKKMDVLLNFFNNKTLSSKEKDKLLSAVKRKLTFFKKHFSSVHQAISRNPSIWHTKVVQTEKELEKVIALYEKFVPLLFNNERGNQK